MGGGGKDTTTNVKADKPDVVAPIAPIRTAAGAQPDNVAQAQFTSGSKRTDAENIAAGLGSSRLVIPLDTKKKDNVQSGGYTSAPKASSIVGGKA